MRDRLKANGIPRVAIAAEVTQLHLSAFVDAFVVESSRVRVRNLLRRNGWRAAATGYMESRLDPRSCKWDIEQSRPAAWDPRFRSDGIYIGDSTVGLAMTLEILVREFSEQSGVIAHCELSSVRLTPSAQLVVYRLVQEAITNLTKYAAAHEVWVTLATVGERVEVSVRDDGVGFDTSAVPASAYGLVGMRFRVAAEKGTLTVVSAPGAGTRIQVSLPQPAETG